MRWSVWLLSWCFWLTSLSASGETGGWQPVGPYGGEVSAVAIDPQTPSTLYVSNVIGVFVSANEGQNWQFAGRIFPNPNFRNTRIILIDSEAPSTLYALTQPGEPTEAQNVFKSSDSGQHWFPIAQDIAAKSPVAVMAIDPQHPQILYAAHQQGVYKSTDSGQSWQTANSGLPDFTLHADNIFSVAIDSQASQNLYLGTSLGLFGSSDGGNSWQEINTGLQGEIDAIAVDPHQPNRLFAITLASSQDVHRLFRSDDGGSNWRPINAGLAANAFFLHLTLDPSTAGIIYLVSKPRGDDRTAAIYKSQNAGMSWRALSALGLEQNDDILNIAVDPKRSGIIYAATSNGVYVSHDGGHHWVSANSGISGIGVESLARDPRMLEGILVGNSRSFPDNKRRLLRAMGQDDSGTPIAHNLPNGWISAITFDAFNPRSILIGLRNPINEFDGLFRSIDNGNTWQTGSIPDSATHIIQDPRQPNIFYAGTNCQIDYNPPASHPSGLLYKSNDSGRSWRLLRPIEGGCYSLVLGPHANSTQSGSTLAIALDNLSPNKLYTSELISNCSPTCTYTTRLLISSDAGETWQPLGDQDLGTISQLVIDDANGSLYAAGADQAVGTSQPRLYRKPAAGNDWVSLTAQLPRISAITSLVISSSSNPSTLYLGSPEGVFLSNNNGASWLPYQKGLLDRNITTLQLDPIDSRIVYAGTDRGGVFVHNLAESADARGLMNVSTRGIVGASDRELIAGFIVQGDEPIRVLVKGEGPILGMSGVITDPELVLTTLAGDPIKSNDDWQTDASAAEVAALAPPAAPKEAAFVVELRPGAYVARLKSKNNASGLGIVAMSDVRAFSSLPTGDESSSGGVMNISTRGIVGVGERELKAGFIVQGTERVRVLVKGEGPILNLPGVIEDPELVLTTLAGAEIMRNDNWRDHPTAAEVASLAPPASDQEAAFVVELGPGAYIAHLSGKNGATGLGLVAATDVRAFKTP